MPPRAAASVAACPVRTVRCDTLLTALARIVDQDTYMASHPALFDPTRRITDGGIRSRTRVAAAPAAIEVKGATVRVRWLDTDHAQPDRVLAATMPVRRIASLFG